MLQDCDQLTLLPLPGRGLLVGERVPLDGSLAGDAFLSGGTVDEDQADGVRVLVQLLAGTERVGVLAFTADRFAVPVEVPRRSEALLAGGPLNSANSGGAGFGPATFGL